MPEKTDTVQTPTATPSNTQTETKVTEVSSVPADDGQDKSTIKPNIDLDSFDTELATETVATTKPIPEAKKEVEKKEEAKVEDKKEDKKTVPTTKPPRLPDVTLPQKRDKEARDYSDLNTEEVEMFKKMGNEAYAKIYPMYKEHKKLQAKVVELEKASQDKSVKLPDNYYEHPEAYVLHPTHTALTKKYETAQAIEQYWESQLALIKEGKDWKMLTMDKDGNFVQSEPIAADGNADARVTKYLSQAMNQTAAIQADYKNFVDNFQNINKEVVGYVKNLEKTYFPFYDDAELTKPGMEPVKEIIDKAREALHPALKNNVLTPFLSKAYALILTMQQKITDLQEAAEAKKLGEDNKAKASQPAESVAGGSNTKTISLEDYEREMR